MKRRKLKKLKKYIFIAAAVLIALILGAAAGLIHDLFFKVNKTETTEKTETVEQTLAAPIFADTSNLSDDSEDDDIVSFDIYEDPSYPVPLPSVMYQDEDSNEAQNEMQELIQRQKRKREEIRGTAVSRDLSIYRVNPKRMDTSELIPQNNAPKRGTLSPLPGQPSELPKVGYQPPKKLEIPIESLDVKRIFR